MNLRKNFSDTILDAYECICREDLPKNWLYSTYTSCSYGLHNMVHLPKVHIAAILRRHSASHTIFAASTDLTITPRAHVLYNNYITLQI